MLRFVAANTHNKEKEVEEISEYFNRHINPFTTNYGSDTSYQSNDRTNISHLNLG